MIKHLHIDGFGQLHQRELKFEPGINVVYGPNESGKTTIKEYILHMLFGLEKARGIAARSDDYTVYMPLYSGTYGGSMEVEYEREDYLIQRNFRTEERSCQFILERTGQDKSLANALGITLDDYLDTFCIKEGQMVPSKNLAINVMNYANNIFESGSTNIQVDQAVEYLKLKKRDLKRELSEKEILLKNQRKLMIPPKEEVETHETYERTLAGLPFLIGGMVFLYLGINAINWMLLLGLLGAVIGSILTLRKKKVVTQVVKKTVVKDEVKQQYEKLRKQVDQLSYEIRQVDVAIEAILESANEIRTSFSGPLNQKVSEFVFEMTDGKYQEIKIDESLSFMVKYKNRYIDIKYLSSGTVEQIYLAIRLAAGEILYPKATVPILFDDIFGNFDEERMIGTLEAICRVTGKQVVLFTCKKSMLHCLNKLSQKFNWISLEGI